MTRRQAFWTSLAAIHLAIAAAGAAGLPLLPIESSAGNGLAAIREASGSDNSYGFFAPAVASSKRVRLMVTDARGRTAESPLDSVRATQEVVLRLGTILDHANAADEKLRRALLASFAAHAFGTNPDAVRVHVVIESYRIPTMAETRAGEKPAWAALFEADFVRKEQVR